MQVMDNFFWVWTFDVMMVLNEKYMWNINVRTKIPDDPSTSCLDIRFWPNYVVTNQLSDQTTKRPALPSLEPSLW